MARLSAGVRRLKRGGEAFGPSGLRVFTFESLRVTRTFSLTSGSPGWYPWARVEAHPSPAAQTRVLAELRAALEPILARESLPVAFTLKAGMRLRRAYGRCTWHPAGGPPVIAIRCTADGDRTRWRRLGAIVGTLLHEVAHLRYRSHGPRFWALHRRLVDRAAAAGLYDPTDRDPAEGGRGDEKLAASAAWPIALAARQRRLERARTRRISTAP